MSVQVENLEKNRSRKQSSLRISKRKVRSAFRVSARVRFRER